MAVSSNANVLNLLKVFYKDKVENLLFRNSPVFSKIGKERIEGKSANFPALAGFSGGVGGSYKNALAYADEVGTVAQWAVEPGQVFGVISFNNKEVMASKTNKGAFLRVADAKMFTSFDAVKKVLAAALYGRGYGEICPSGSVASSAASGSTYTFSNVPEYALMTLVPGMRIQAKATIDNSATLGSFVIESVNGSTVTAKNITSVASAASGVICLADSYKVEGNAAVPVLPVGLAGWLPNAAGRTGAGWTAYIAKSFYGVVRNVNADALCGAYYTAAANEAKNVTLTKLIRKVRRQGSKCDLIILNDEDWADVAASIPTTDSYFTQTSGKGKRTINGGVADMTAAFSTNYIENIYDDPFLPKSRFYVLESDAIKFWSYSNAEKAMDTGVAGNEPGTMEVTEGEDVAAKPYQLNIDDILTLQPGIAGDDGATTVVGINVYGTYVITNTAHCGVGNFYEATPSDIQVNF